jgi:hypothetical protein
MIRWTIRYAGSEMGYVDAKTHGWALRKAMARWGGRKDLYAVGQLIYLASEGGE